MEREEERKSRRGLGEGKENPVGEIQKQDGKIWPDMIITSITTTGKISFIKKIYP